MTPIASGFTKSSVDSHAFAAYASRAVSCDETWPTSRARGPRGRKLSTCRATYPQCNELARPERLVVSVGPAAGPSAVAAQHHNGRVGTVTRTAGGGCREAPASGPSLAPKWRRSLTSSGTAVGTGAFDAQEPMMRIAKGSARFLTAKPHFTGQRGLKDGVLLFHSLHAARSPDCRN